MQPTTGKIDSGEETAPASAAKQGRHSRMRTIQPIHTELNKPRVGLDILTGSHKTDTKPTPTPVPQPLTLNQEAHPAEKPSPLHDTTAPHPVAPREALPPPLPEVDPIHQSVPEPDSASQPEPTAAPKPAAPTATMPAASPAGEARPEEPLAQKSEAPDNPLPKAVEKKMQPASTLTAPSPAFQAAMPPATTPPAPAAQRPAQPPVQPPTQQPSQQPAHLPQNPKPIVHQPTAGPQVNPVQRPPTIQSYALDKNDALMRSSNPLAATLSGIELLIKRNGIVSIAYVSIFLTVTGVFLGSLYAAGRFLKNEFLSINFSLIAIITLAVLLVSTYLCSFVVCVASEAGQSLSLRHIFYLTRQNIHKLLALQVLTILAVGGGLLLGIVPGVIILGRWMMAPFMIFESDHPSIMTAIKRSNKLTKGRTVEMTGLVFAQLLLLSTGLLGFAAMAAGPAARYQQLRMRINDRSAITKVHFLNYVLSFFLALSLLGGVAGTGYYIYSSNETTCYNTIKFVNGKSTPVNICVKRHVCQRDIICRETIQPRK